MSLDTHFQKMGARVKIGPTRESRFWRAGPLSVDVRHDNKGEYFDIRARNDIDLKVVDVDAKGRHLLLLAHNREAGEKDKFLCGHDERAWFVAAVPDARGVSNVKTAKEALKPAQVLREQDRRGVRTKDRGNRHTEAYIRQGEWFFLPRPNFRPRLNAVVHKNEPITRGAGSKPHMCAELFRNGGEQVYVNLEFPNGINDAQFRQLPKEKRQKGNFRVMQADAQVYVRGAIRHSDHKTVQLDCWHLVVMNTESGSRAMRHVRFLD